MRKKTPPDSFAAQQQRIIADQRKALKKSLATQDLILSGKLTGAEATAAAREAQALARAAEAPIRKIRADNALVRQANAIALREREETGYTGSHMDAVLAALEKPPALGSSRQCGPPPRELPG